MNTNLISASALQFKLSNIANNKKQTKKIDILEIKDTYEDEEGE